MSTHRYLIVIAFVIVLDTFLFMLWMSNVDRRVRTNELHITTNTAILMRVEADVDAILKILGERGGRT